MSNVFTGIALLAILAAIYFLARAIIALVKKEQAGGFAKKMFAAVAVVIVSSVGLTMVQTPEEKAAIKAKQEAKAQAEADKKVAEQKAAEEKRLADEQAAKAKAEQERQAAEAQKVIEAQKQQDAMLNEIKTGWNVETTDTSQDYTNGRKAASLVVKYPNYIHEAPANWIDPAVAMKKPWEFYGQVVNLTGNIYAIEQLPPGNPASKFFGGDCYEAMLAAGDVAVSIIIVGDSSGVSEHTPINVKGYIFGHAPLVNKMGGESKGLAFVGFAE